MDIIVGTAGHIDHGKTALVKALTGTDADRLPEEKQRGITIDLGFAELETDGVRFGFVDVPGHERFIKNMLAGASGIDLVLFVIAADEGVMPQTREHFDICRLLGTNAGVVVLTKADLVDAELLELVKLDVADLVADSFLSSAPVIAVSSKTGDGIDDLKASLLAEARALPARDDLFVSILPIDRSFTVKGFGAVITGTLTSGKISESDEMEILPMQKRVRIRGLQTHGRSVETAQAGQRVAVNLAGVEHTELARGMVLSEKDALRPTQMVDAEIEVLGDAKRSLRSRQRVRVHIGTAEVLGRVQALNASGEIEQGRRDFVQLRLEVPVAGVYNERFIIRSYSPQMTIAGGRVLDIDPAKHRKKDLSDVRDFLHKLAASERDHVAVVRLFVEATGQTGATCADLQARTALNREILQKALADNVRDGLIITAENYFLSSEAITALESAASDAIESFHKRDPLSAGIARETLREKVFRFTPAEIFRFVLAELEKAGRITADRDMIRLSSHNIELTPQEVMFRESLTQIYYNAGLEVRKADEALADASNRAPIPSDRARKIFQLLVNSGEIIKITEEFYFSKSVVEELITTLRALAEASPDRSIDMPKFKEVAGVSRKYAIPLLEYFDREKITRRAGDKRVIL